MMKKCKDCGKRKRLSEFTPRSERSGHYTVNCKDCRSKDSQEYRRKNRSDVRVYEKSSKLKIAYGITLNEFNEILKRQGERCAICRTNRPSGRGFGVDHDHKTGRIRGILCHSCNTGIGLLKDSPKLLEKALKYLVSPRKI